MSLTLAYDFLSTHRGWRAASLSALTLLLTGLLSTLHFSEDISDFLPLGPSQREQMSVYQNISGADRMYLLFSNPGDEDRTVEAMDRFLELAEEGLETFGLEKLPGRLDMNDLAAVSDFVYENAPYFLTEADLLRADSLLALPDYLPSALNKDRQALLFSASPLVTQGISQDPLGLFSPLRERLQASSANLGFELYDGYIFTPDLSRAVLMLDSPFGSSETKENGRLLAFLEQTARTMQTAYPDIEVDCIGGPAIAVGNSSRIKKDSILAISLSLLLMALLLGWSIRSPKNILLIFLTTGWGMLFALGGMALFRDSVSIIVIGIASVILGIAINYPLHLIAHRAHQSDRRAALGEIVSPLLVGNITTVGAFLALVPLQATALHDLGLFAALLLIGTILFVLFYLPHYLSVQKGTGTEPPLLGRLSSFAPENKRSILVGTLILTLVFAYFSFRTEFDTDLTHINYMTPEQKRDMQYFEDLLTRDDSHTARTLYLYGKGTDEDAALEALWTRRECIDSLAECGRLAFQNEAFSFFVPRAEQQRRLERWNEFLSRHRDLLTSGLSQAARQAGFADEAFRPFYALMERSALLAPLPMDRFEKLRQSVFSQNFTCLKESGDAFALCPVNVQPDDLPAVKAAIGDACFDIAGLNKAMTGSLSDNFNYIGWACSLIVFFFLWFSFGRIELALISFLPMAISWVWILGLMALLGIKFNIVNIILATFIFGQGDDYTIFMTEGCQYEYARRKSILPAYKSSILQSAAIMFVGIGTLIVARHPAMRSLAEVTFIGMFSVVLMAWLIPPFLFQWLTRKNGAFRRYPLTLKTLLLGAPKSLPARVEARYLYQGKEVDREVHRTLKQRSAEILRLETAGKAAWEYTDEGYGELSLLLALSHPELNITAHLPDEERRSIACAAALDFADNLIVKN